MKEIPLNQGKVALVDDEDYKRLMEMGAWNVRKSSGKYYVANQQFICRVNGKQISKTTLMHRLIMDAPIHLQVDHINGDTLDNRKCNLRLCTASQNQHNRKAQCNNKTGYKGVCLPSGKKKYKATIYLASKPIRLGYFNTAIEAARAYNEAAIKYHGEFANLNKLPSE